MTVPILQNEHPQICGTKNTCYSILRPVAPWGCSADPGWLRTSQRSSRCPSSQASWACELPVVRGARVSSHVCGAQAGPARPGPEPARWHRPPHVPPLKRRTKPPDHGEEAPRQRPGCGSGRSLATGVVGSAPEPCQSPGMTCHCGCRSQELDVGVSTCHPDVARTASGCRTASNVFFVHFESKSRLNISSILCPQ